MHFLAPHPFLPPPPLLFSIFFLLLQAGAAGVGYRLGRKLATSSKARIGGTGGRHSVTVHVIGSGSGYRNDNESSDDDSEGRGAAIGRGVKRKIPIHGLLKGDLIAPGRGGAGGGGGGGGGGGKKKKKGKS